MSAADEARAAQEAVLGADEFAKRLGVGAEVIGDMRRYQALLEDWSTRMNLVGPSALTQFWPRHAWDSAQLLLIEPDKRIWVDVGAGAGFPGLVLAIALKGRPDVSVHLVESLAKRCRFLDAVSVALDLPVVIHNRRAEQTVIEDVEVVTARACAPMIKLLGFTEALMRGGAFGLFLKGRDAQREIGEAREVWRFDSTVIPSRSGGAEGYVVKVEGLSRA